LQIQSWNVFAHCQDQNRNRQTQTHPKLYRERSDLVLFVFLNTANRFGFKRHPTLWALTRMVLFYLRMHRTGVFGSVAGSFRVAAALFLPIHVSMVVGQFSILHDKLVDVVLVE